MYRYHIPNRDDVFVCVDAESPAALADALESLAAEALSAANALRGVA